MTGSRCPPHLDNTLANWRQNRQTRHEPRAPRASALPDPSYDLCQVKPDRKLVEMRLIMIAPLVSTIGLLQWTRPLTSSLDAAA